jgi:hypothetical protein
MLADADADAVLNACRMPITCSAIAVFNYGRVSVE